MAYAQGSIVIVENPYADGRRPVMIVSTTDRTEAVRLDTADLTEGEIDVYPSFVNVWSLHEFEHDDIGRRVAQVSNDVVRAVADGIARYTE